MGVSYISLPFSLECRSDTSVSQETWTDFCAHFIGIFGIISCTDNIGAPTRLCMPAEVSSRPSILSIQVAADCSPAPTCSTPKLMRRTAFDLNVARDRLKKCINRCIPLLSFFF